MTESTIRIGDLATQAGVSCRTLRYYGELGLLVPSGQRAEGSARRYSEADLARLLRIKELQELMGFDLDEIGAILGAEDRLAELRAEWEGGAQPQRQEQILAEVVEINNRLRAQVRQKMDKLGEMLAALEDKAKRYRRFSRELELS
ncbi:MAG: MerR family transcriptional regulator, partial [Acidimicrobiales bacterium]